MTEPNEYISVTRKNFISNDNEERMIKKNFVEIQGTFLVKISDNTFNGTIKENVFEHVNNFLEVVGPIKINGVSRDRFRLSVFPISLAGAASEWFKKDCIGPVTTWEDFVEKFVQKFYQLFNDNEEMKVKESDDPNDITEIFRIEGNIFDYETPFCKAFNNLNYLLKINTDLFTFDIQGIRTYKEYGLNNIVTRDLEESWLDNGDHKWYDELVDGKLKEETLMHKVKVEESWGDATPGVMKFCAWLKNSFENFYKLDYNVLVKMQECWWKVNTHEVASFTRWESYGQGPYANAKTKRAYNLYLDINRIFGRNYGADNADYTQDNQEHKKEHHDPSTFRVRKFEMIKYLFDTDDEYVVIKEHECSEHSETNIDTCQAYRELFRIMDEGWLVTKDLAVRKSTIWYTLKKTCVELV
ncbi:hypothetical protein Tco_0992652 [Tanacetum coccineum]|uniref:Retrotransposon gag domain-containing protein n=1 Tax=Tanacetum coccineum TaxID=301880 RepID=A0ABQ5F2P9_9ASTR